MQEQRLKTFIEEILKNVPDDWLNLTTHRLDIYNEKLAKLEFIEQFEKLYESQSTGLEALKDLPTAYDYIRLGHPLSCVLEWLISKLNKRTDQQVISFSSKTTPILAILRKNLLDNKNTQIIHSGDLPFDAEIVKSIYGYNFEVKSMDQITGVETFDGSKILITEQENLMNAELSTDVDFSVLLHPTYGSVVVVNGDDNDSFISEIQHVRRRESIAMTPSNCLSVLQQFLDPSVDKKKYDIAADKQSVINSLREVTESKVKSLVASSGLSMQYAIMMGLIHDARVVHPGKPIKFIVPPNCYGGTNDQARRVAACLEDVEIVDLPVDGGKDMVDGIELILNNIAEEDAVPYIIAEIPTNPRVEVPDLERLKAALAKERKTPNDIVAVDPVFILDQTFCPNVHFLGEGEILSTVRTIVYASGSKFPSGGLCTAGYAVSNAMAEPLMEKIELHLNLCDNEATALQYEILAKQLPSMIARIDAAYKNTRDFVNFIQDSLPDAKINFVSEELAALGFTPSVFSLDLPTKGNTDEEKENYKRSLNHQLIKMMITEIPHESKHCVSYGQLKGCYWTIPATSTQGTTKEGDKDYIARVALSGNMDLEHHKKVFKTFVSQLS